MSTLLEKAKDYLLFSKGNRTYNFTLTGERRIINYDARGEKAEDTKHDKVSKSIDENLAYVKKRFKYPINSDIVIREITLKNNVRAFVVFIDGMVDTDSVNNSVIKTLQTIPYFAGKDYDLSEAEKQFISHSQARAVTMEDDVFEEVNFGCCGVYIDGVEKCYVFDVRGWEHRSIEKSENEKSIYGPQEAFGEMIRTNTALIRKIIKDEDLIVEGMKVGSKSKTRGVLLYISHIANEELVNEAKRRIGGVDMDYVISVEEVAQMVEEKTYSPTTHFLITERPDRVARALARGRVAFMLNGSPQALIMPTNIFELTHAVSDDYLRVPYANFAVIVRALAIGFSILLPALYLAVTLFHHEVVPTYLLYSISAARENVPFPSIAELLLMDLSFEMIREAGLRMPGQIGSTLGIVGGLILGQAAVSAKIVSPIMIIVIAITGIGSFATSDYSLAWSFRVLKIIFIFLSAILGFYGIAIGIFLYSLSLASQKSFGAPFLAPTFKARSKYAQNAMFLNPIWRREKRPGFLYTKEEREKPKISRNWKV